MVIDLEILYLVITSVYRNSMAIDSMIVATSLASMHFIMWSNTINNNFLFLDSYEKGPRMCITLLAKGTSPTALDRLEADACISGEQN